MMPILNRANELHDEIVGWRRHIHQHPEIGFEVHQAAEFVARKLEEFGVNEIHRGFGETGVVGVIRGRLGDGPAIALRADMDALPIVEATSQPHASTVPGTMHACGHDGHTAMLLGAAKYLAETRNFKGSVVLVFQPAEEIGGGARAMIDDGLFDRFGIGHVYGMHNMPGLETGRIALRPGSIMAASAKFTIRVTGRGGHAARPHTTIDPIVTGAQIVTALLQPVKDYITKVETDPTANRYRVTGAKGRKAGAGASVYRGISTERSYETRTKAGDKIGNRIEWLAEQIGCRIWMGAQGELIIGRPDYAQAPMYQPLYVHLDDYGNVTGSNCLIRHSGDIGDRHAKIAIVAQGTDAASALGNSVSEFFESVADPSESFFDVDPAVLVKRVPKTDVMTTQGAVDQKAVTRAARTRLEERAVKSAELTISLDGHRQSESVPLWACDTVVNVDFQPRDVNAPYYIWRCALRGDEHGRTTELAAIPCGIWMAVDHDTMSPQAYLQHILPLWKRYAL